MSNAIGPSREANPSRRICNERTFREAMSLISFVWFFVFSGINIGPIHKRDVMKASVMLEHDDQWAVILAFDVKV